LQRSLALLDPARRPSSALMVDGYLDLLREAVVAPTSSPALRPLLRRVAKGPLGPGGREERRFARLLLRVGPGDEVLDAGCGTGAITRDLSPLAGPGGLVVGLDASADTLAEAVRATPAAAAPDGTVAYVRADVTSLPFGAGRFAGICCFGVLEHLEDPWTALDEMTRVLAPGGRIALLTTCRTRTAPARTWDAFVGARAGMRMFEPSEISGALADRGFEPVRRRIAGLMQFAGGTVGRLD
jgi:ubiquinone/menaquinone biosynthesis C-methylase UbiE